MRPSLSENLEWERLRMTPEYVEAHAVYEEDREDFLSTWDGVSFPHHHWDDEVTAEARGYVSPAEWNAEVRKLTDSSVATLQKCLPFKRL